MHVTKYHLSRFPPVKQMSRYWSAHRRVHEGLVLNFLWLSRNSEAAPVPGLHHTSERGPCCGFYWEAWLLHTTNKILGISLTNCTLICMLRKDIKHAWKVTVTSAICSQGDSLLPILLSAVVREDSRTLGSFWHLSSTAREFSQPPHWALTAFIIYTGLVSDVDLRKWVKYWEWAPEKQTPRPSRGKARLEGSCPSSPAQAFLHWKFLQTPLHPSHLDHTVFTKLFCMTTEFKNHP